MKYIDLFAGVGGFRYGIEVANSETSRLETGEKTSKGLQNDSSYNKGKHGRYRATCVYSNEWDKYANSVYKYHWKECDERDIRTVKTNEIPDHDLLCAGFPCQAFSVAGKRLGFEDTRGTLFFEIARIARDKRPRYLLLENVKGLLSHDKGKTFQTILGVLSDLGYGVQWQVLNSKHFGVPQNRERVFIVGHLRGESRPKVFPIKGTDEENPIKGVHRQPLRYLDRNQKEIKGDYGYALDGSGTWGINDGDKIRRLTPIECERLQGFPDNFTKYGHDGKEVSDSQRYKMMGNAVTTNVISAIITRIDEEE